MINPAVWNMRVSELANALTPSAWIAAATLLLALSGVLRSYIYMPKDLLRLWLDRRHARMLKRRPYEELDPHIAPLVNRMNATGTIRTVASCQGHVAQHGPYVYFYAPIPVAKKIDRLLWEAHTFTRLMGIQPLLDHHWTLEGTFRDGELAFNLRSSQHDRMSWRILWSIQEYVLRREKLDAEFVVLAELIERAVKNTPVDGSLS